MNRKSAEIGEKVFDKSALRLLRLMASDKGYNVDTDCCPLVMGADISIWRVSKGGDISGRTFDNIDAAVGWLLRQNDLSGEKQGAGAQNRLSAIEKRTEFDAGGLLVLGRIAKQKNYNTVWYGLPKLLAYQSQPTIAVFIILRSLCLTGNT